jgi:glycosyltransferase involved in cell wall biosynthesis
MYKGKKVSVVFGTYNEVKSIRSQIDEYFATGLVDEVIAIDNNAKPGTKEEIEKTKAKRIIETKQGYGFAYMRALSEATGDLIFMTEVDGTFKPADLHKFLLYSDDFPVVFGTRTSRAAIFSGAFMPFFVRFANWLWAKIIEVLYNGPVFTDVGCTSKLLNRETLEKIKKYFPESPGDGRFSPEIMIWITRIEKKIIEIPVIYKERSGGESGYTGSTIKAAILGFKMIPLILKYKFKKI